MIIERKTGGIFIDITRNGEPAAKKRLLTPTKLYLRREG